MFMAARFDAEKERAGMSGADKVQAPDPSEAGHTIPDRSDGWPE
jgi:hypothetical protein